MKTRITKREYDKKYDKEYAEIITVRLHKNKDCELINALKEISEYYHISRNEVIKEAIKLMINKYENDKYII